MSHVDAVSRRNLLKLSLGGACGLLATGVAQGADPTAQQTQGPFHPLARRANGTTVDQRIQRWVDQDSDLTFVSDNPGTAYGQLIYVEGVVTDEAEQPLEGAQVEIWQACVSGRYNHRRDPNSREWLDPNFQYWGKATSDAEGKFMFRTVVPGAYKASDSWIRPPHIHAKLARRGYRELTTQLYFEGVEFYYGRRFWPAEVLPRLNAADGILQGVPASQRDGIVARARVPAADEPFEAESRVCSYRLVLERAQATADPALSPLFAQ
ncbi:MAG: protocatechuate 3,4-dioxygenase [Planctomycetes bacterium]|nr:protocatechuate 3,4-dioxygenase [Planctomycetota bacterium]